MSTTANSSFNKLCLMARIICFQWITTPVCTLMIIMIFISSCNTDTPNGKAFSGMPGGQEGPPLEAGPPMNPESWHVVPEDVLGEGDFWGYRVNARTTFRIPGGLGLFYSSHPGPYLRNDPEWRAIQTDKGNTLGPAGGLAFTHDLITWHDHPDNPILNEVKRSWQTPHRVHVRDLFYDPQHNRWVSYFGNICGDDTPGIRSVGVAYSNDLVHWDYADGPLLTIEDFAKIVPDQVEASPEELYEAGRVYANWGMYLDGRYYLTVSGTLTVGYRSDDALEDAGAFRSLSTGSIVLVADSPEGPFEHVPEIGPDQLPPGSKPVYWDGKWYTVFAGNWDGQPGIGLAWSDQLFGEYIINPENPVVALESIQRINPILFEYDGTWVILYSRPGQASAGRMQTLRMAVSNIHPSLLSDSLPVD